jgi:hypothetical protein
VLDNAEAARDPLVAAASRAMQEIRLRLTLNGDGEFTGLVNQAEVVPKLQSMTDAIVRELSARLPADQRKTFQNLIAQVLSPAALIASATREAEIYFGLNGVTLANGEAAEAQVQVASPIGGGVIPATFTVRMQSATADSATLTTSTTYDAAAVRRMTESLAQQAGASATAEDLAKVPALEIGDDGKYVFDRRLGLMREVIVNRRASVGNVRRYDGWEIRLLTRPNR